MPAFNASLPLAVVADGGALASPARGRDRAAFERTRDRGGFVQPAPRAPTLRLPHEAPR